MEQSAAEIVKGFRSKIGLSQVQMAAVLRISQGNLSEIESGGSISKRIAKKLAVITEQPLELFIN